MKSRLTLHRKSASTSWVAPLRQARSTANSIGQTILGRLVGVGAGGEAWVDLPAEGLTSVPARTTVPLVSEQIGREVLITFVDGSPDRPVVIGVLREPADVSAHAPQTPLDAIVDGERIVLTGRKEVVLRCGKASIVLAEDGKVIIKGAKFLATASGLNRIKGGAVQIN
jgi:hypothetical protein